MENEKQTSNWNFNVQLFWKSGHHNPQFTFDLWKKNFRMSREEFIELCE